MGKVRLFSVLAMLGLGAAMFFAVNDNEQALTWAVMSVTAAILAHLE